MLLNSAKLAKDYRLKDLIRYNTRTKITNESVAEHSYFVCLYVLEICNYFKVDNETKLEALSLAVIHDLPEIDLSDIPHDVKMKHKGLNKEFEIVEEELFGKLRNRFNLKPTENTNIANKIVKAADLYSVIQFCEHEKVLGNQSPYLDLIINDTTVIIEKLEEELYGYYY